MIILAKIKAGALQFVLFIGTIIVLLLFAFILMYHGQSLLDKKTDIIVDIVHKADQALIESFGQPLKIGQNIDLLDNVTGIETHISKNYWGLLEQRSVVSKKGKLRFEKMAFVGYKNPNRPALYLKDENRPMVIAGDAKLSGNAYLPERGIKMGNIRGHGYIRPRLVYGKVFRSKQNLPELNYEVVQRLKEMTGSNYTPKGHKVRFEDGMNIKNSFQEEPMVITGESLVLNEVRMMGNIVIRATRKIQVKSTSRLRDVVLVAPTIEVEKGTRGTFQAISSRRIFIGKGCQLDYPTILAVQQDGSSLEIVNSSMEPVIHLENDTSVSGSIFYLNKCKAKGSPSFVRMDSDARLYGELYSEQSLELEGVVNGNVTTGSFVSFENGNTYLNHLFKGKINAQMVPEEYCGSTYDNKMVNGIVKWLY